jgi:hypothetical protein
MSMGELANFIDTALKIQEEQYVVFSHSSAC